MTRDTAQILKRKTAAAAGAPRAGALPGAGAVARAAARAARDAAGLDLSPGDAGVARAGLSELPERLPGGALLVLLDGAAPGAGLAALDPALVEALVSAQITGRPPRAGAAPRPVSEVDAALCRGFLAALLDGLEGVALGPGATLADPARLPYVMAATGLAVIELALDLPPGGAPARLLLALPDAAPGGRAPAHGRPAGWTSRLATALDAAPVPLGAVLCRRRMALSDLQALRAGDRLVLPADALARVELCGAGGARALTGRLGQVQGQRAVRIGTAAALAGAAPEGADRGDPDGSGASPPPSSSAAADAAEAAAAGGRAAGAPARSRGGGA